MLKVLITGITGFLGSHIAKDLIDNNISVIGIKRSSSDTWRCQDFEGRIEWLDYDNLENWKKESHNQLSIVIIHCAWIGVEAKDRDDWLIQSKNIDLLINLLDLGKYLRIQKFIFLGSQAEYGIFEGKVDEDYNASPTSAYGSIKLASLEILKTYSIQNNSSWLWLRVFSVFGEKEDNNWLIPSIVSSMKKEKEMNFTAGEQKYAYLYVDDFSKIVTALLKGDVKSGIYNISSNQVQQLKSLIESIRNIVNPSFRLNFGAIPYRNNQSMHIEGDITKLISAIGPFEFTDFNVALLNTLKYYISN